MHSIASLSLDLDNQWSYMKTHGDAGWENFPTYLDVVVPRVLGFLEEKQLKITFFIVGQDAALKRNVEAIREKLRDIIHREPGVGRAKARSGFPAGVAGPGSSELGPPFDCIAGSAHRVRCSAWGRTLVSFFFSSPAFAEKIWSLYGVVIMRLAYCSGDTCAGCRP